MPASVAYFIHLNEQTTGPFSEDEVRAKLHAGEIKEDTLVAKGGSAHWTPLSETTLSESKVQLRTGTVESTTVTSSDLQFDRAEFAQPRLGAVTCSVCKQAVHDAYFHINGLVACAACKERIESSGAGRVTMIGFGKSLLFGVGAAIAGAVVWYAVTKITGLEIGLIAIAVGFLVGIAVRKGSRGWGGWQYQTLAVVLTYFAIVATYVPPLLKGMGAQEHAVTLPLLIYVFVFACAVPFLAGAQNFLGWIIIGIALYQAWRINHRVPLEITGPYKIAPASNAP